MTRRPLVFRIGLLLGLPCLFAACAVMEISVDVYKGPLANHEHVQAEQMSVMAIGAKPLLIELRDRLEWGKMVRDGRDKAIAAKWYKAGFVPKPPDHLPTQWFQNVRAQRVNAVLFLYEDFDKSELEPLFGRYS